MKRRLEIARGLLHRPSVLFLDEPTQGLDPQTRSLIWRHLLELREASGTTLFMTTHYMDEAEYCDRIAIIDNGTIVALGTPDQLKDRVGGDVITLRTDNDDQAAREIRDRWGIEVQTTDSELRFEVEDGDQFVPEVVRHIGPRVAAISVHRPTLDDVFMKLTGHAIREQEGGAIDRMRQFNRAWSGGR
jgi:ABC-2 type transport system ATP-binding protein